MWPNDELSDEDDLAEAVIDAYSAEEWDAGSVLALLDRGERRQAKAGSAGAAGPHLLRVFVAACSPDAGVDFVLSDGRVCGQTEAGADLFEVAAVENSDRVACDDEGAVYYVAAADVSPERTGVPLATFLAAWLFHDELVKRGLDEHPRIEDHARESFPEGVQFAFSRLP